ncbi:MAG: hypothetical protein IPO81_16440 [Kouleothrix sp.]|nr:hypothetical protein [Kouleothrix sp.]
MELDALPLLPNGKIDRHALLALDISNSSAPASRTAPRDILEMQLVLIWEEVLRCQPIGVTDNFFDLGGHSLTAVSLTRAIKEHFDKDLPVAALFQAPTIEQLAAVLRESYDWPLSPLIPIRTAGTGVPMFWIHPVGGHVLCYMPLVHHLPDDQPVYTLQSPGLYDGQPCYDSIPAMAQRYIQEIRKVQPEGPYMLGGWSMGGIVAFEMSQQLTKQGQEVRLLTLIDSWRPDRTSSLEDETEDALLASFLTDIAAIFEKDVSEFGDLASLPPQARMSAAVEAAKQLRIFPEGIDAAYIQALFNVFKNNRFAMNHYAPQPYAGDILLFQASDQPEQHREPALGWASVSQGKLESCIVPATHYTLLREPAVTALGERLAQCVIELDLRNAKQ